MLDLLTAFHLYGLEIISQIIWQIVSILSYSQPHTNNFQDISLTLTQNIGSFRSGSKIEAVRVDGSFPCLHTGCSMGFRNKYEWYLHFTLPHETLPANHNNTDNVDYMIDSSISQCSIESNHNNTDNVGYMNDSTISQGSIDSNNNSDNAGYTNDSTISQCSIDSSNNNSDNAGYTNDSTISQCSIDSSNPPLYSNSLYMLSAVKHLDQSLYSSVFDSNSTNTTLKYEQICEYYFQSRYNRLFTDRMPAVRKALAQQSSEQNGLFGPLSDRASLDNYKKLFITWITTIIKLRDYFETPSPLNDWFEEIAKWVEIFVLLPPLVITKQQQAFSHVQDIPNKGFQEFNHFQDRSMPHCTRDNYFRVLANHSLEPWPGAIVFGGLGSSLVLLHEFLIDTIVKPESSGLIFLAVALLLSDGYHNGVPVWKPAEQASEILNGLLYAIRLIIFTQLEITNTPSIDGYVKQFLDPDTETFVHTLYSLKEYVNWELENQIK